jgi:hypothetical protein
VRLGVTLDRGGGAEPCCCSSTTAAFSCGIEAETFGSLMMFAWGVLASSPSSASASSMRCPASRYSGKPEMIRPAREMSRVSTRTPAVEAYAWTTGRNEYVARAGASSVCV